MISGRRIREIVIVLSALAAGLGGTAVAIGSRDADSEFLFEQRNPDQLTPAQVARAVRTAPDPQTGEGEGESATCRARGPEPLRNPWSCVVRYGPSRRVPIEVQVADDGTYSGRYEGGGTVRGCCVPSR